MMHTAACNILKPAYLHRTNTPAPMSSAAENVTVKVITSFRRLISGRYGRLSGVEVAVLLAA